MWEQQLLFSHPLHTLSCKKQLRVTLLCHRQLMPANPGELEQNSPAGNGEGQQNRPTPAVLATGSTNSPCPVLRLPKGLGWLELCKLGGGWGKSRRSWDPMQRGDRHQELPRSAWGTTGGRASPGGRGAGCWGL